MYYAIRGLEDVYFFDRTEGEIYFFTNGSAGWNYTSPSRLQRSVDLCIANTTFARRIEDLLLLGPASSAYQS
jgi:hypothetical protein